MENRNEKSRVGITMNKREKNRKWYVVLLCGREKKTIREKNHTQKTKNERIQKRTPKVILASELRPRKAQFLRLFKPPFLVSIYPILR